MRIVYFGSGEFGLPTLRYLRDTHELLTVVTQPDRPAGRHRKMTPTPIGAWTQSRGISAHRCEDVNAASFIDQMRGIQADAAVIVAFGQKLSDTLITATGRLVVNLHASLLPKYRGAAPINQAMINGERETGVSVISLAQRMDAGLIYAQATTPIDPQETAGELHDRLALMGPKVIDKVLDDHDSGRLHGDTQDESRATQAGKLSKADAWIDFDAHAKQVRARIHGLTPWPGVQVDWVQRESEKSRPLRLLRVRDEPNRQHDAAPGTILEDHTVAVRHGGVQLLEVQVPGGRPMTIDDFIRGHPMRPGDVLNKHGVSPRP